MIEYDFTAVYTQGGIRDVLKRLDEAGKVGFHVVAVLSWDGNHQIIMERERGEVGE